MMSNQPSISDQRPEGLLGILQDLRVAWRLLRDPDVSLWLKGIPFLSLVYLLWPFDFLADSLGGLGQLDDLAVIMLAVRAFMALCPAELVSRHRREIASGGRDQGGEVIEANYRVLDDEESSSGAQVGGASP